MVELVKSSLTDTPQLSTSNLYRELASLLRFFCKGWEAGGTRRDLTRLFWSKLVPECEALVRNGKNQELSRLVVFFLVLKYPKSKFSQRREGVRFADEFDPRTEQQGLDEDMPKESDSKVDLHTSDADEFGSTADSKQLRSYTNKPDKEKVERERVFLDDTGVHLAHLIISCHDVYLHGRNVLVFSLFSVLLCSFPSPRAYANLVDRTKKLGVANGKEEEEKDLEERVKEGKRDIEEKDTLLTKEEMLGAGEMSEEKEEGEKESTIKMRSTETGEDDKRNKAGEVLEHVVVPRMEGWDDSKIARPTANLFLCLYESMGEEERKLVLSKLKVS